MLLVKTILKPSNIHGIGLFAAENIKKGTVVWCWMDNIDSKLHKDVVKKLPMLCQEFIEIYAWQEGDLYYLCGDNCRFANHSSNPNVLSQNIDGVWTDFAIRDIGIGEELTYNYWDFHQGNEL